MNSYQLDYLKCVYRYIIRINNKIDDGKNIDVCRINNLYIWISDIKNKYNTIIKL